MHTTNKPFNITKKQVYEAYKAVKSNGGAAGVDKQTIEQFEAGLQDNLYKLWNRMSSGSYFAPPVRAVPIPKKSGGRRIWVCQPWRIAWLRWSSSSLLSQTWSQYFWQTPMAIGRGNPRLMRSGSRESGAGDMTGFSSLISKVYLITSTTNSCYGPSGSM